jgi:hypothetical protein
MLGAPKRRGFGDYDGAVTNKERDALLEWPDNLLVVRPELEIQDGQSDDADKARFEDAAQWRRKCLRLATNDSLHGRHGFFAAAHQIVIG